MIGTGNFVIKQSNRLIENKQLAIFYAVLFSIMPFASWLSVALVILISLRKGARPGFEVMLPALIIHSIPLMMWVPLQSALINTLITYIPCYIAAIVLRRMQDWSLVFAVFFIQALLSCLVIQLVAPHFIQDEFNQLMQILNEYKNYQQVINNNGLNSFLLAQLFLGVQILSITASAMISLLFARSIQSKLFLPGGFREELLKFRSGKLSFAVLLGFSIASYYEIPVAINLLPLVLCYFFLAGFNLVYYILLNKNQMLVIILLLLIILLKPFFVLAAYVIIGSLDSLLNFRLYLPQKARELT